MDKCYSLMRNEMSDTKEVGFMTLMLFSVDCKVHGDKA